MKRQKYTKEQFLAYHQQNPHLYQAFCEYALQAAQRRSHFSAKAIFHVIRWNTALADDQPDFKINDGWISHYARMFVDDHPEHAELFELRLRRISYHQPPPPPPTITGQGALL